MGIVTFLARLVLASVLIFQSFPLSAQRRPVAMSEIADIKKFAGLTLPDGADIRFFKLETDGEYMLRARVGLSSTAFADFLRANQLTKEKFSPTNHGMLATDDGGWEPAAHPAFPVYAAEAKAGAYLYVGYIAAGAETIVYIEWFRT